MSVLPRWKPRSRHWFADYTVQGNHPDSFGSGQSREACSVILPMSSCSSSSGAALVRVYGAVASTMPIVARLISQHSRRTGGKSNKKIDISYSGLVREDEASSTNSNSHSPALCAHIQTCEYLSLVIQAPNQICRLTASPSDQTGHKKQSLSSIGPRGPNASGLLHPQKNNARGRISQSPSVQKNFDGRTPYTRDACLHHILKGTPPPLAWGPLTVPERATLCNLKRHRRHPDRSPQILSLGSGPTLTLKAASGGSSRLFYEPCFPVGFWMARALRIWGLGRTTPKPACCVLFAGVLPQRWRAPDQRLLY